MKRALFYVFAVFAFGSLVVTSIWAWWSIREDANGPRYGVVAEASAPGMPSDYGAVGEFAFTERSGERFECAVLHGKVWIANFIFTSCPSVCPRLSATMAKLQRDLAQTRVQLVSFTVDPERDTPEKLREYAKQFEADPQRWAFLTGEKETIHKFIQDNFHLAVGDAADKANVLAMDITHSGRFVLVDREGKIRGFYDAEDPAAVERLRAKAVALAR